MTQPNYARVDWQETIEAPVDTVRSQFGDLDHHIQAQVHPRLRFEVLERAAGRLRYAQEVRLLGILQRDVFERSYNADGSIRDLAVEGPNRGGEIKVQFVPAGSGTRVDFQVALPVPRFLGWLKPLLTAQVRREVRSAAAQDKADIESGVWKRRGQAAA